MQPTQRYALAPRLGLCGNAPTYFGSVAARAPAAGDGLSIRGDSAMPEASEIRDHLEKLRSSAAFARSSSLFAFLAYVVEETLAGRGLSLKELVIGDALYSASTPYDPGIDSTVRVEARRLRRKLAAYYEQEGRGDPVRIDLPVGSYRPSFAAGMPVEAPLAASAPVLGADLAIMPFRALSGDNADDTFADGLTDELIFALGHQSRLRLAPRLMVFQYKNKAYALAEAAEALGVGAVLHGTFRAVGARTRVTVELSDPHGFVIWSAQVNETTAETILLQERLAEAIVAQLPRWMVEPAPARSVLAVVA